MKGDKRYRMIGIMVETGNITAFREFFDYIPPTVVKDDLGTNYNRLKRLMFHVEEFTIKELFRIGEFCGISEEKMLELAHTQIKADKASKTTRKRKK